MPYLRLSFAQKQIIINRTKFWAVFVCALIILGLNIIWLWKKLPDFKRPHFTSFVVFATTIILWALTIWGLLRLLLWIEKRVDAKVDAYAYNVEKAQLGDNGEKVVYQELQKLLDQRTYKIYKNITLPNLRADLDIVVLGPKGLILIEVKNYEKGKIIYNPHKSFYLTRNKQEKPLWDLRAQVKWRAEKLEEYLAINGIDNIRVHKLILYLNPDSVEIRDYGSSGYKVYIAKGIDGLKKYLSLTIPDPEFTSRFCRNVDIFLNRDIIIGT